MNVARAARAKTAGGMKWLASRSRSAGIARWRCFIEASASCVSCRRSTGSGTLVKIGALISMIRLP